MSKPKEVENNTEQFLQLAELKTEDVNNAFDETNGAGQQKP